VAGAVVVLGRQMEWNRSGDFIHYLRIQRNFSLNTSTSGVYDVVADATVKPASGPTVTYAATVTFGGSRELEPQSRFTRARIWKRDAHRISYCNLRSRSVRWTIMGSRFQVGLSSVRLCSLSHRRWDQSPKLTFSRSRPRRAALDGANAVLLPTGSACANYSLLIPSGIFHGFVQRVRHPISLSVQQLRIKHTVERKKFIHAAPALATCTPGIESMRCLYALFKVRYGFHNCS